MKQDKTKKRLLIPIHHEFLLIVDHIEHDAVTILATSRGTP
ncbi:MAG: hypothetical protein OEM91_12435 [Hyphomicrobiales bacterium]|nr:hypothetical protein [Hyphomicrobiales bacterium]